MVIKGLVFFFFFLLFFWGGGSWEGGGSGGWGEWRGDVGRGKSKVGEGRGGVGGCGIVRSWRLGRGGGGQESMLARLKH